MRELIFTLLGGVAGYLLKRWIERSHATEHLNRLSLSLDIQKKMAEGSLTLADVEKFQRRLLPGLPWRWSWRQDEHHEDDPRRDFAAVAQRARVNVLTELNAGDPENFGDAPQQIMNEQQAERLERATAIMQRALEEVESLLVGDDDINALKAVQRAWLKYRNAQAEFASLTFKGGSMQPLIYYGTATALTIDRIVELRTDIHERKPEEDWPPQFNLAEKALSDRG